MDKKVLASLVEEGLSQYKIGEKLGIGQTSVRYWLKKYNLKTNVIPQYKCQCGETDKNKFYQNKTRICGKCHNQYTINKGKEKRNRAIEFLGGNVLSVDIVRAIVL